MRQEVFNVQILSGKYAVKSSEAQMAFSMKKIRDMRGIDACLARKQRSGECAPADAAQQFAAKLLMKLRGIHCGNFS